MAVTLLLGICLGFLAITVLVGWPTVDEPSPQPVRIDDDPAH